MATKRLLGAVAVLLCACLSSAVKVFSPTPLRCSTAPGQDLNCTARISNCMDRKWLQMNSYTPSAPEQLQVSVSSRRDEAGRLQPVLLASWKIKDDGSISYLRATELHVLVMSTNQNLCVRYTFKDRLPMRSPSGEQWSFSADMLVLDPGETYHVSVFNIPKPEINHSNYHVQEDVTVPGCQDPRMKMTQFCIQRGSLWRSNISVTAVSGRSALAASFTPDPLCEDYMIIVNCQTVQHISRIRKANQTTLDETFSLDKWPQSCCQFDVSIKPYFPPCGEDCPRQRKTTDICPSNPTEAPEAPPYTFVAVGVIFMSVVLAVIVFFCCRKSVSGKTDVKAGPEPMKPPPKQPPSVLVIYSQDHHLYRDVVLKLCAFLQAECGIKVVADLLDSTSISMVGRVRWLEWQQQQLKNPSDKILVLCSKGVQAKWKALCGQRQVTLREDILSPTDDMLTPFLNLFLPKMHRAGMLGKYMVAYFSDIANEQDVPSVFDIAIRYNLMKHFEELYFRILDIEKYQPGQVNHIKGIGVDEYFNCPSGKALKNAIETFQAYQLENPDWFDQQCVENEEEILTESHSLIEQMYIPPVLECVPLIKNGHPLYMNEVELNENGNGVHIITPELNPELPLSSVTELLPVVKGENKDQLPSGLDRVWTDHWCPQSPSPESAYIAEPVFNPPPPLLGQNWVSFKSLAHVPTEDERNSLLPMYQPVHPEHASPALQNSLGSNHPESSCVSIQSRYPFSAVSHSQPAEMEEEGDLELKRPSSGSDQGYISKVSSQHERPCKEDPLVALARLQEQLFQQNL
ncbi:interleukin 17 receptor A1a [Pholidichthys leucotaenia]